MYLNDELAIYSAFADFRGCRNEPGFLKMFNGYWGVEPRMVNGKSMGCNVVVTQEVLPSMLPPGPLGTIHMFKMHSWGASSFAVLIKKFSFLFQDQ